MKNSFSLLEVIIVVIISSIVIINSLFFLKESYVTNRDLQNMEISKIDLLSTKIFLSNKSHELISSLRFQEETLFFKNSILLENVSYFTLEEKINDFQITIQLKNEIKQFWNIKR